MNNPLITIAMPVYNVERYVERALLSALNQTYDNIEILVVDDKGPDGSMDIVRSLIDNHSRGDKVRIIDHKVNLGLGATRNSAIREAHGEYLFFMDSDDYITPDCIEKLYSAMKKADADMAVGSFMHVSVNDGTSFSHRCSDLIISGKDAYSQFYLSRFYYVQTWNKLYRLDLLRSNEIYCIPSNTNEDIFFSFQLFPVIHKIILLSEITYFYAIGDSNSVTFNMRNNFIDAKRVNQFIGILMEMNKILMLHDNVINMQRYMLEFKAQLIRDICWAGNISLNEKKRFLEKIPINEDIDTAIPLMNKKYRRYLLKNPLSVAKKEKIYIRFRRILGAIKNKLIKKSK